MLRLLRIFSSKKRARSDAKDSSGSSRKGPIAAGAKQRKSGTEPKRQTPMIVERRRPRWAAPELDGPEFSGLIERRATDARGRMLEPYDSRPDPAQKERDPSQPGANPEHGKAQRSHKTHSDTSSTGVVLSVLENSSITLADSGKFKVGDEDDVAGKKDKRRYAGRFNPYDGD